MIKDRILEDFAPSEDVLFADGLDEAIIGFEPNLWKVVYSRSLVVDVLMKRDGIGEKTPLWVENYNW